MLAALPQQLESQMLEKAMRYPELFKVDNCENKLKKAKCIDGQHSFFYILNKLLQFHCRKTFPSLNYDPIHDCLKNIWDNEHHFVINMQPLFAFFFLTNSVQDLVRFIIIARYQAIINAKNLKLLQKETILIYHEDTQKRFDFMIEILEIVDEQLYLTTTLELRSLFFNSILSDLSNQLECTSIPLFFHFYNSHHQEMALYAHYAIKTKIRFSKKLKNHLHNFTSTFNKDCITSLLGNSMFWTLHCARFYYIIGQNALADTYIETYTESLEPFKNLTSDEFSKGVFGNLSEQFNLIQWSLKKIPTIKLYTTLIKCIEHTGDIEAPNLSPHDLSPAHILKELKKHNEVNFESISIIQQAIASLGLAYKNEYDQNLNQIKICKKIATKLNIIFFKSPYNIMATYMQYTLFLHMKKIEALEQYFFENNADLKIQLLQSLSTLNKLYTEKEALGKKMPIDEHHSNETLQKQKAKIKKLKTKIEGATKKDTLLVESPTEDHTLLKTLQEENVALRKKHLLLSQNFKQIQSKINDSTQQEAILKSKIQELKEQKEKLEQDLQKIQYQLNETPKEIIELKRKKEQILQKNKVKKLNKKITQLQSKQDPLINTKAQIEASLDAAHQASLTVNAANQADNQEFEKSLSGFNKILSMVKESLESQYSIQTYIGSRVFYAPSNPVTNGSILKTSQAHTKPTSYKRNHECKK